MLKNLRSRYFLGLGLVFICLFVYVQFRAEHDLRQREVALKQTLYSMRASIDQYTQDKNTAPQSMDDLIRAGYLHNIPVDPLTNSSKTWKLEPEGVMHSLDQTATGITDVHSGSDQISTEGTPYSSW